MPAHISSILVNVNKTNTALAGLVLGWSQILIYGIKWYFSLSLRIRQTVKVHTSGCP